MQHSPAAYLPMMASSSSPPEKPGVHRFHQPSAEVNRADTFPTSPAGALSAPGPPLRAQHIGGAGVAAAEIAGMSRPEMILVTIIAEFTLPKDTQAGRQRASDGQQWYKKFSSCSTIRFLPFNMQKDFIQLYISAPYYMRGATYPAFADNADGRTLKPESLANLVFEVPLVRKMEKLRAVHKNTKVGGRVEGCVT